MAGTTAAAAGRGSVRAAGHVSDEVLVLIAPFRGYEILAARPSRGAWGVAARVAIFLTVVGGVGAFTTAGRLVLVHVLSIAAAWSFVPVIQAITVGFVARRCTKRLPILRAIDLHMAGNGPYLAFFLSLTAVILFAPDVQGALGWLFSWRVLHAMVAMMLVGGTITSFAFYRICGETPRRRALALVAVEWLLKVCLCLAWYSLIDNLAPQFLGERGAP